MPADHYMQAIDGRAYGASGLPGMLGTDAGLSIAACALLLPLVLWWRRSATTVIEPAQAPAIAA